MPNQNNQQNPTENGNPKPLGKMVKHYPVHNQMLKRWVSIILGGLSILTAIGLTIFLAIRTWDRINVHGRAVILSIYPFPTVLYALLLMIGALLISLAIIYWQDGIEVFEKGLVRRTGQRVKSWIYEDTSRFDTHIAQITFAGSLVNTRVKVIFENPGNTCLVIHNRYEQMPELIDHLRTLVLPKLIEKSRQRLLMGEKLVFHKHLQASESGLMINGDLIPYQMAAISVENQVVKLHEKDNPKHVFLKSNVQQIKNLDLLFNLLENPPAGDV
jgi:hypothetical protein